MALHSVCLLKDTFSVHRLLSFTGTLEWPSWPPPPGRPLWCEDFHTHLDLKAKHSISLAPNTPCMGSRPFLTPRSPSGGQGFRTAVEVQHFCTLFEAEIGFTVTVDLIEILSRTVGIEKCFLPLKYHCFIWPLHFTPKICPGWGLGKWGERRLSRKVLSPFPNTLFFYFFGTSQLDLI